MSLIPTIYSSTDPGAPQLSGTVGSMISLLRAVLVTGYGTAPNHKPGLGWTEEFTGTNKAVFRGSPVSGTGYCLQVVDDGSVAAGGSAGSAGLRGFSQMSDVDTGLDPTPMVSQLANGVLWPKSSLLSSLGRAWFAIGNERTLYLFVDPTGLGPEEQSPYIAGDIASLAPNDAHCFFLSGCLLTAYPRNHADLSRAFGISEPTWAFAFTLATTCGYFGRSYGGVSGAVMVRQGRLVDGSSLPPGGVTRPFVYPFPIGNGLLVDQMALLEAPNRPRGMLPGVYAPLQPRPFADQEVITDLPELRGGGTFLAKSYRYGTVNQSAQSGQVIFDISGEW